MRATPSSNTEIPDPTREVKDSDPNLSPEEKAFVSEMVALSATGILIRKGKISVRMFSMGGGKTITAYILQESADGFIVALPAVLSADKVGESVMADFVSPVPLVKFYKTGTPMMALPTPSIFYNYLRLSKDRFHTLPGYFNDERKTQIDLLLIQLKENFSVEPKRSPSRKTEEDTGENPWVGSEDSFFVNEKKAHKYRH